MGKIFNEDVRMEVIEKGFALQPLQMRETMRKTLTAHRCNMKDFLNDIDICVKRISYSHS